MATVLTEKPTCVLRQAEVRTYTERVGQSLASYDKSSQRPGVKVSVTVCHTAAQLYVADKDPLEWRLVCAGVPVVIDVTAATGSAMNTFDSQESARFIAVVDYKTSQLMWRQEVSAPLSPLAYRSVRQDFHTFRGHQWAMGLLFAHSEAAERFRRVLLAKPKSSTYTRSENTFPKVEVPATSQTSVGLTNSRNDSRRDGRRRQLTKSDISGPTHFVHVSHIGLGDLTTVKPVRAEQVDQSGLQKNDPHKHAIGHDQKSAVSVSVSTRTAVETNSGRSPPRPHRRPPPPPPSTPPSPPRPSEHDKPEKNSVNAEQVLKWEGIETVAYEGQRCHPPIPARNESIVGSESKETVRSPQDLHESSFAHQEEITVFSNEHLTALKAKQEDESGEKVSSCTNLLGEIVQFNKKGLRTRQAGDNSSLKPSTHNCQSNGTSAGSSQDMASVMQDAFAKMMQKFKLNHQLEHESEFGEEDPFENEQDATHT